MARKPFHQFLGDVRAGELNEELTAKLTELVTAVQNTGKAGSITLRITITPTKSLAVEIDDDVSVKLPKLAKPTTLLFPTVEGNLQVQNPLQKTLDLKVVDDGGVKQLNTVGMGATGALAEVPGASAPTTPVVATGS
jgi:hypothetical protein